MHWRAGYVSITVMENIRKIRRIVTGSPATDGAGVRLVRVLGHRDVRDFDPFLLLDAFDSTNPDDYIRGFPWHPHRGIETVTYLVSGIIEHGDSLGNKGTIGDGDCQWMTAGSGIIHQEMPKPAARMLGVQLWVNLPAKDKMTNPTYRDLGSKDIPVVEDGTVTVRPVCGSYKGVPGPFQGDYVRPQFLDIAVQAAADFTLPTDPESSVFVYLLAGAASFPNDGEGQVVPEKSAVLFSPGDYLRLQAGPAGVRLLLISGRPLKEGIAWGGPIVMNTQEELDLAFRELDAGTFIKGGK